MPSAHRCAASARTVTAKYGIEVLHEESYNPGSADMMAQLNNIKAKAGVQAVINPGFGHGPATVARNYRQLGIRLPLYQSHGVGSKRYSNFRYAPRTASVCQPRLYLWQTAAGQRPAEEGADCL